MVVACAGLLAHAAPALAHAERSGSTPQEGTTVRAVPGELQISFTEPPTGDAVAEVLDGCGRDVVADVEVQNLELTASLDEGQPGKWTVRTNVISGIDGHNTRDRWTFTVRGEADCEAAATEGPGATGDEDEDDGGGGSIVPLLAIVGGTLALVIVGLLLRGRSG